MKGLPKTSSRWVKLFFLRQYRRLSRPVSQFYLKGLAILAVAVFTFVQWALPLYWDMQTNFEFHFTPFDDGSVVKAEPMVGFDGQCLIWGSLSIKNKSTMPLHIKNTHLAFIPHDIDTCAVDEELCVKDLNYPNVLGDPKERSLFKFKMYDLMKDFHNLTIQPVTQEHDLFPDGEATRPFTIAIATNQIKKQRLTFVAEQEYGYWFCKSVIEKNWYPLPYCDTSRTVVNIPSPCDVPVASEKPKKILVKLEGN